MRPGQEGHLANICANPSVPGNVSRSLPNSIPASDRLILSEIYSEEASKEDPVADPWRACDGRSVKYSYSRKLVVVVQVVML
jgi:hypothetical protein